MFIKAFNSPLFTWNLKNLKTAWAPVINAVSLPVKAEFLAQMFDLVLNERGSKFHIDLLNEDWFATKVKGNYLHEGAKHATLEGHLQTQYSLQILE